MAYHKRNQGLFWCCIILQFVLALGGVDTPIQVSTQGDRLLASCQIKVAFVWNMTTDNLHTSTGFYDSLIRGGS